MHRAAHEVEQRFSDLGGQNGRLGGLNDLRRNIAEAEVMTMEAVGEYLGLSQDTALYRYFRHHYRHFFPGLERRSVLEHPADS